MRRPLLEPGVAAIVLGWACASAWAQDEPTARERVEAYASRLGLDEVLAASLRDRLARAEFDERDEIASRLADVYVRLLDEADTPEEHERVARLGRALLDSVPESTSHQLHLTLEIARYVPAERVAELDRLLLASSEDRRGAVRVLRDVHESFARLGATLDRDVRSLERRERTGSLARRDEARETLAESRRLRSLAKYYSGWSGYYLGLLEDDPAMARAAMIELSWVLDRPGEIPDLERLPRSLLRYEHVARSAIGVALCWSLADDHVAAVNWIDEINGVADLTEAVAGEARSRRLLIYAAAGDWARVAALLGQMRDGAGRRLSVTDARMLTIQALDAIQGGALPRRTLALAQSASRAAVDDLVGAGEIGHVLGLLNHYGDLPIRGEGFIVGYVRGLQAYEIARSAHVDRGLPEELPVRDRSIAALYGEAVRLLDGAITSEDAGSFRSAADRCGLTLGLALYYANESERAAARLASVIAGSSDPEVVEEAMWLRVVALDRAVEDGRDDRIEARDAAITAYLDAHPRGARAARLVMRHADLDLIPLDEAIATLESVPPDAPSAEATRRYLTVLLYRAFRRSVPSARGAWASRFVEAARPLIDADAGALRGAGGRTGAADPAELLVRARQLLDVTLVVEPPLVDDADATIRLLDRLAADGDLGLAGFAEELLYRRVQLAEFRGRASARERALEQLQASGGRFAAAAERFLYQRAVQRWVRHGISDGAAREIVRFGSRVIETGRVGPDRLPQASFAGVLNSVARAAEHLWMRDDDRSMLELAVRVDRIALEDLGRRTDEVLRRHARLAEALGETDDAITAWLLLMNAFDAGSEAWFEARYQSLRLMLVDDPVRAAAVIDQHEALYPDLGPEPWGPRIAELRARVRLLPLNDGGGP